MCPLDLLASEAGSGHCWKRLSNEGIGEHRQLPAGPIGWASGQIPVDYIIDGRMPKHTARHLFGSGSRMVALTGHWTRRRDISPGVCLWFRAYGGTADYS